MTPVLIHCHRQLIVTHLSAAAEGLEIMLYAPPTQNQKLSFLSVTFTPTQLCTLTIFSMSNPKQLKLLSLGKSPLAVRCTETEPND
jgi:hypothetical protein